MQPRAKKVNNGDYLSDTDPEEYADILPFSSFTQQEKETHLKKLWRSTHNLASVCAQLLIQKEAIMTKI